MQAGGVRVNRKHLALAALAISVLLAGCDSSLARNFGDTIARWQGVTNEVVKPISDITTYYDGDFAPHLGFSVISWHSSDELAAVKFFAIDGWFGQIEYNTPEGYLYVLRVAQAEQGWLAGTYAEGYYQNERVYDIGGNEITVGDSVEGDVLARWEKNGFQYTLHSRSEQGDIPQDVLQNISLALDSAVQSG